LPFNSPRPDAFDNLAGFINRMSSFDSALFVKLPTLVIEKLKPTSAHDVQVYTTYLRMLSELESLVASR